MTDSIQIFIKHYYPSKYLYQNGRIKSFFFKLKSYHAPLFYEYVIIPIVAMLFFFLQLQLLPLPPLNTCYKRVRALYFFMLHQPQKIEKNVLKNNYSQCTDMKYTTNNKQNTGINFSKIIITERFLALLCYIAAPAQTIN